MSKPNSFQQRCVQDLAWVIQSPPLISGTIAEADWWGDAIFAREYADCFATLKQLDHDPTSLLETLSTVKSKRLGHYFEALIAYWFIISPNYDLLLKSYQLRNTTKTLGEIDFLLRERSTNKVIHLEVSVKFYLGIGDLNNMANWHGPGLRDWLDRKFKHLCEHQTQLARKHPELIPYGVDETACLIKGRLFYPTTAEEPATNFTHDGHFYGYYYPLPNVPDSGGDYLHLGKDSWLAEVWASDDQAQVLLPTQLHEPVLYARCENGIETERFFVLPEGFLNSALR